VQYNRRKGVSIGKLRKIWLVCGPTGFAWSDLKPVRNSALFFKDQLLELRARKEKPWVGSLEGIMLVGYFLWFYLFLEHIPPDLFYILPW
jgi:hypothetical protein